MKSVPGKEDNKINVTVSTFFKYPIILQKELKCIIKKDSSCVKILKNVLNSRKQN